MMKNQHAFTLIELMVTLAVFAILIGIALPSFQTQIVNNRSLVLADELVGALNYARTEALKRGKSITFCPTNSAGTDCGTDWKSGWLVVVDTAASEITKPPVVANSEAILKRWEARNSATMITMDTSSRQFIRFTGAGTLARTEGAAAAVITAKIDQCKSDSARVITIALSGMLTTTHAQCE